MAQAPLRWPVSFLFYNGLTRMAAPVLAKLARSKHREMGAPADRLNERFGIANHSRPEGKLVWVNAASLGELRAALPIIERLRAVTVLVTTTTQSSAEMAASTLPDGAIHQFAPLDTPTAIASFLAHWRPDLAVFMESDILIRAVDRQAQQDVPMAVLNARPSTTRDRFPGLFAAVFSRMSLVTAQDERTVEALGRIGVDRQDIAAVCDLKSIARPPRADADNVGQLASSLANRPVWLAMSLHPEEGAFVAETHKILCQSVPDAALIIAPRHPAKAQGFAQYLTGVTTAWRSQGQNPDTASVYIADTLGEAGTLFAVAPFALIGGTLAQIGGHSPQEALNSGRPVLFGDHPGHHAAAFHAAEAAKAALQVKTPEDLAQKVQEWLDPAKRKAAETAAAKLCARGLPDADGIAARLQELLL